MSRTRRAEGTNEKTKLPRGVLQMSGRRSESDRYVRNQFATHSQNISG